MLYIFWGTLAVVIAFFAAKKQKLIYLSFLIVALVMGLQNGAGNDYESYQSSFQDINLGQYSIAESMILQESEVIESGWGFLCKLFFPLSFEAMVLFLALFECYVICKCVIRYVNPNWYWIAVSTFYFTPDFMPFQMSALRQALAFAFFIMAFILLLDKKIILPLLLIIVGSLIHQSAIFMLPIAILLYFVSLVPTNEPKPQKKIFRYLPSIFLSLLYVAISINQVPIKTTLASTTSWFGENMGKYEHYVLEFVKSDFSILIQIYNIGFVFCAALALKKSSKNESIILWISIITQLFQPITFGMSSVARGLLYLSIFNIIAIPIIAFILQKYYTRLFAQIFAAASTYYSIHYLLNFMGGEYGVDFANYKTIFNF